MKIEELLAMVLEVDPSAVGALSTRSDFEAWDSLTHLSVVAAVEETYAASFSTSEMGELTSVAALRAALAKRGIEA